MSPNHVISFLKDVQLVETSMIGRPFSIEENNFEPSIADILF